MVLQLVHGRILIKPAMLLILFALMEKIVLASHDLRFISELVGEKQGQMGGVVDKCKARVDRLCTICQQRPHIFRISEIRRQLSR